MLYSHNRTAYNKVMEAFGTKDKVCIVHSTGTGKGYIAAEVAKNFKRVLIVVPNEYIQYHLEKLVSKNVRFTFYHSMLSKDFVMPHNLDLIILDEFHRAGAEKWGEKVRELLINNPKAKVFGTTATEIRYLDNGRDMAEELFDGNVVSRITLKDAWTDGILPIPVYVTGLYDLEPSCRAFEGMVANSIRLNENARVEALKRVNSIRMDFRYADGVSEIIKKHFPKKAKRVLVFCDKIKNIPSFELKCMKWFFDAGIMVSKTYTANVSNPNSLDDVKEFTEDENGVKIMFSVNMLNEGIHVEGVDVVILLRSTKSRIVHLQQIGRCFAAKKDVQPVILDLVDNLYSSSIFDLDVSAKETRIGERGEMVTKTDVERFYIYDYVKPIRDVMEELSRDYRTSRTFDEIIIDLKSFLAEYNRRPTQKHCASCREHKLGVFVSNHKDHPIVIELLKDYPTKEEIQNSIICKICEIMDSEKRIITKSRDGEELARLYNNKREDPRIHARWLKYSVRSPFHVRTSRIVKHTGKTRDELKASVKEERKAQLFEHIERTGEWPKSANVPTEEASLYTYWTRHEDEEVNSLREKLANRMPSKDDNMVRFKAWVKANRKRPKAGKKASEEENWANQYYQRNKEKKWIADLFKELGIKTYKEEHPEPTREDVIRAIENTGSKEKAAKLLRIGNLKLKKILNGKQEKM